MEAAFFDLDKTVIARASMMAYGPRFYREGLIGRRSLAKGLWSQAVFVRRGASEQTLARMRTSALALIAGWEQARVRAVVTAGLAEVIGPLTYADAVEAIDEHRRAGHLVAIVSAAPEEIVEPVAAHLGVDVGIGSRAEVDAAGRYTGRMLRDAYGLAKAEVVRALAGERGIDLAASWAYSDSVTDLPMLEAVGHPVAVNPDRDLAQVAAARGWPVRHFGRAGTGPGAPRAARRRPGTTGWASGRSAAQLLGGEGGETDEGSEDEELAHGDPR